MSCRSEAGVRDKADVGLELPLLCRHVNAHKAVSTRLDEVVVAGGGLQRAKHHGQHCLQAAM